MQNWAWLNQIDVNQTVNQNWDTQATPTLAKSILLVIDKIKIILAEVSNAEIRKNMAKNK